MHLRDEYYDSSKRPHPIVDEFFSLIRYWDLVGQFVSRSIKTRYKRSFLGVIWTMLNPLLTMIVLTLVFSQGFRFEVPFFPVYLLSGLTIWNYFSSSSRQAMVEMFNTGGLLNRIYIPKSVFVVASVGTGLFNLAISLVPLLLIAVVTGLPFHWAFVISPFAILLATVFTLGIGLILATAAVYFYDIMPFYDVILMIWMYATPIIYPIEIIPEKWLWLFRLNPLYYLVELFRKPLLEGASPEPMTWFIATAFSLVVFLFGWFFFTTKSNEFAYRI